ncbi:hypothetical protein HPP92_012552 [Vanilla planifolia]|uniref:Glucan endo-1,3-beta-D-glucosidase n=1 Tax=Vanilla planifolia TaxID=51239 RepID=A0A835R3W5_VANPL|nr:hypothetical protein HPP92_012552 [Vanilla planifolia]
MECLATTSLLLHKWCRSTDPETSQSSVFSTRKTTSSARSKLRHRCHPRHLQPGPPRLAADPSFAASWVGTHVAPYASSVSFRAICAGNEVIPGNLSSTVLPASRNLEAALSAAGFFHPRHHRYLHPSTCHLLPSLRRVLLHRCVLGDGSPRCLPCGSGGAAASQRTPYFAYVADPADVDLGYALFGSGRVVIQDVGLGYTNLFDAMVDSVHAAVEKAGSKGVRLVVSETGWPSGGGGPAATVDNARAYNNRLVKHVKEGTPSRPGEEVEVYLFAMFNENLKPEGTERNFGLYNPDMTEVYHVDFNS